MIERQGGEKGDDGCGGRDLFCGDDGGQGCAVEIKTNLKEIKDLDQ